MISTEEYHDSSISYSAQTWQSLKYKKAALIGLGIIIVLTIASFMSTIISGYDPNIQGDILLDRYLTPGWDHLFGTDKFGRDIFSRVLYGGRISLTIAISVVFLSSTIGLIYGAASGYFGGKVDAIMMRFLDFLLAFPLIFLVIMITAIFSINHWYLIPILGFSGWMETARLVRAEVLSIKERDYILAARGLGFNQARIIFNHVIPNCFSVVLVLVPLKIAEVILLESALSFLGIGVQPPTPSWGNIINDGREALLSAWWISTFPGMFITSTVISFHLIADGLRDCLTPNR
jgi:peptide/nickel transport system permease protein